MKRSRIINYSRVDAGTPALLESVMAVNQAFAKQQAEK